MSKSILIVEDYPETAEMLRTILEAEGYSISLAETGEKALEKVAEKRYDLILLDIMLPRIDGFEVCRRIKADPKTQSIPVIAVTAFDVQDIVKKCTAAGADDVILKPFDVAKLLETIKKYLS